MVRYCEYADVFGKPREGIHAIRVFDVAIVDLLLTILTAYLLTFVIKCSFWIMLGFLILLGILLHYIFCVDTKFNSIIFD